MIKSFYVGSAASLLQWATNAQTSLRRIRTVWSLSLKVQFILCYVRARDSVKLIGLVQDWKYGMVHISYNKFCRIVYIMFTTSPWHTSVCLYTIFPLSWMRFSGVILSRKFSLLYQPSLYLNFSLGWFFINIVVHAFIQKSQKQE